MIIIIIIIIITITITIITTIITTTITTTFYIFIRWNLQIVKQFPLSELWDYRKQTICKNWIVQEWTRSDGLFHVSNIVLLERRPRCAITMAKWPRHTLLKLIIVTKHRYKESFCQDIDLIGMNVSCLWFSIWGRRSDAVCKCYVPRKTWGAWFIMFSFGFCCIIISHRIHIIYECLIRRHFSLRWRHNERDCVSNHQLRHCLLNHLFGRRSKKTSKLRVTGLCAGNSPGTGEFPAQMASNAENVSIWWRHHAYAISALFKVVSLVLWQSHDCPYDCPNANETTLNDMVNDEP